MNGEETWPQPSAGSIKGHVMEETVLGTGQQAYGEMGPDREET